MHRKDLYNQQFLGSDLGIEGRTLLLEVLAELQLHIQFIKILLDVRTEGAPDWLVILVYQSCSHSFIEIGLQKPPGHQAVLHLQGLLVGRSASPQLVKCNVETGGGTSLQHADNFTREL